MNRSITYVGALPRVEDILQPQQDAMIAVGVLARTVIGPGPVIEGLHVLPTNPRTLAVMVLPGTIFVTVPVEATPYGVLPADTERTLTKAGFLRDALTLSVTPPSTAGHSIAYTVQVGFRERDGDALVLPYYNAANPSQPFLGPNNSGGAQNTRRLTEAVVQLKAGVSAPSGSEVAPAPDPGFVALATVTVANGATQITSANIKASPTAPRAPFFLQQLRPGFSTAVAFSVPGTYSWVVPDFVTRAWVRVKGGGGGGSGGATNPPRGGDGGAGGGYAEGIVSLTPGTTIVVTVGVGGAAGPPDQSGGAGGTSSFGTLLTATGGQGGTTPHIGPVLGGVGSGGNILNMTGYSGGQGWPIDVGGVSFAGGMGGACYDTSHSHFTAGDVGLAAAGPGGGGGGGGRLSTGVVFAGARGGDGIVIIAY